jgi:hypothetical protein
VASAFAGVAVFIGGIIVVGNVSMAFHRDTYPAAGTGSIVLVSLVPLAAALSYFLWRGQPDHQPAVLLRRVAMTVVVIEVPLLLVTFGIALSGLGG